MKLLILAFVAINFSYALDLECNAPLAKHKKMKNFVIVNFSELLSDDPYAEGVRLLDKDARLRDNAFVENGVIMLSMHNGCDNYYELDLSYEGFKKILGGEIQSVQLNVKYNYPAYVDEYEETGEDFSLGTVSARCELI